MKIDAKLVKELREKSGAPMGDCLKALQEAKGDMENAFVVLRKRGMASAAKKASPHHQRGRGRNHYIHAGGKIGVLIELNCESDFVARTDDFQELLRDIAMHIAATDPRFVGREEVPQAELDREKEVFPRAARDEGQARGRRLARSSKARSRSSMRSSACSSSRSSRKPRRRSSN